MARLSFPMTATGPLWNRHRLLGKGRYDSGEEELKVIDLNSSLGRMAKYF